MAEISPEDLVFDCRLSLHGVPGAQGDPDFYPHEWSVKVTTTAYEDDDEGEEEVVGSAEAYLLPDVRDIDLLYTLDALSQELAGVAEMLTWARADLLEELALGAHGDILCLGWIQVEPKYRVRRIGHQILKDVLGTVGRAVGLVLLQVDPALDEGIDERAMEHRRARRAIAKYWQEAGFQHAYGDYYFLRAA